jgi:hypothetical protein
MSSHGSTRGNTALGARAQPTAVRNQPRSQMRGRAATADAAALDAARQAVTDAAAAEARAGRAFARADANLSRAESTLYDLRNGAATTQARAQARQALIDERVQKAGARNSAAYQKYVAARAALPALERAEEQALQHGPQHAAYAAADKLFREGRAAGKTDGQINRTPEARALAAQIKAGMKEYTDAAKARYTTTRTMESALKQILGQSITEERISAHPLASSHQSLIDRAQARADRARTLRAARTAAHETTQQALDRARGDLARAEGDKDLTRGLTGVHFKSENTRAVTNASWESIFKQPYSEATLVRLAGAHPGDTLRVQVHDAMSRGSSKAFSVDVTGHGQNGFTVSRQRNGDIVVRTGSVARAAGTQRQRSNARDIVGGLNEMRHLGVARLETEAGGYGNGKGFDLHAMNGYYTWARVGFTGKIADAATAKAASDHFGRSITRVEQVMRQPGGAQWWKQHGSQFAATFDFRSAYSNAALAHFERALGMQP